MSGYLPTEDGLVWVNTDMVEAVKVKEPDPETGAGWSVILWTATGHEHVYTDLVFDLGHAQEIVGNVVGMLIAIDQGQQPPVETLVEGEAATFTPPVEKTPEGPFKLADPPACDSC
jgi:hypothetical protein